MTSVAGVRSTGTQRPQNGSEAPHSGRGPRCRCGAPIEHVRGKVPKSYCSDRCRKAAKREITRAMTAASNPGHLGKESTEFRSPPSPAETSTGATPDTATPDSRETAARSRKSRRFAGRRTLWRITGDSACKGCGRALMDPASGVLVAQTAAGSSVVLGLMKCARIWFCPVCSAVIRHRRAEEISAAVVKWIGRGGTAYLVTLTARHGHADRLADLMDAIQGTRTDERRGIKRKPGAYQRLISGAAWAGDARRKANSAGIRGRVGFVGMIRATEITVGPVNLWHPHIHAILFVGGRTEGTRGDKHIVDVFQPSASALDELEDHFRAVWTRSLQQINPGFRPSDECTIDDCPCGGRGHGVDFKRLRTMRDAQDLSEYIAKSQDGKSPALELARGDLKAARHGNMTPFEMLYRVGDLIGGVSEDDAPGTGSLGWCLDRWHEYERAARGRRAIEWTRYLRPMLGIVGGDSEEDDRDLLFSADAGSEFRGGVAVTEEGWSVVARRALDLEVTQAAEGKDANYDPGAVADRVREVLAVAGVPESARQLTTGEVADAYAAMLESLARRREEAAARRKREAERDRSRGAE